MEPSELLRRFVAVLDRLGIRYLVAGSMATTIYGEPRFTNDIDVVVDLRSEPGYRGGLEGAGGANRSGIHSRLGHSVGTWRHLAGCSSTGGGSLIVAAFLRLCLPIQANQVHVTSP